MPKVDKVFLSKQTLDTERRENYSDFTMQNQTFFYLRDETERPFGVMALVSDNNKTRIGVSVCHSNDSWDRHLGQKIALGRAKNGHSTIIPNDETPNSIHDVFDRISFPMKDENGHTLAMYKQGMPRRYRTLSPRMEKTFLTALRKVRPRTEN